MGGQWRAGQVSQGRGGVDPLAPPCASTRAGGRRGLFPRSSASLRGLLVTMILLGSGLQRAHASAASQERPILRTSDVEVLITRALALLQAGAYQQANTESAQAIPLDRTGQARYLYGVSCSRLGDYACAVTALEPLRTEFPPGTFPDLQAELTRALLASNAPPAGSPGPTAEPQIPLPPGSIGDGGALLSRSPDPNAGLGAVRLNAWIGLSSGMELNVPGAPDQPWVTCGPAMLGDLSLLRSCGVLATERLGVRLTHPLLRLELEGLHRWYPEPSFHRMTLEGLRLELGTARWHGLEGALGLEGQALADRLNPLYSKIVRATLAYTHLRGEVGGLQVAYRPSWEQVADLAEIWAMSLPEGSECSAPPAQTALACTSGKSGLHSRLGGAVWWTRPRSLLRLELWGDWILANQARYSGLGLEAAVKARALLHSDFALQLELAGNLQDLDVWTAGLVGGKLALSWTPLPGIVLTGSWNPSLSLAAWHESSDTPVAQAPALYRRQSGLLELTWSWQKMFDPHR